MKNKNKISTATELDYIENISTDQAIKYVNKQIQSANNQLYRIEKSGVYSQAYYRAQADIDGKRWKKLRNDANINEIKQRYAEVLDFKKSPSYSIKYARENQERILNKLESEGITISNDEINDLMQVLHSNEYGRATNDGRLDSTIAYNEIVEAISYGANIEEIKKGLQEYALHKLDISDFQERVAPERYLH